jgi:hypothetical protein
MNCTQPARYLYILTGKRSTAFVGLHAAEFSICKGHALRCSKMAYCDIALIQQTLSDIMYFTATVVAPMCSGLPVQFHARKSIRTCTPPPPPPLPLTLYTASDSNRSVTKFGHGISAPDTGDMATFRRGVIRRLCSFRCLNVNARLQQGR